MTSSDNAPSQDQSHQVEPTNTTAPVAWRALLAALVDCVQAHETGRFEPQQIAYEVAKNLLADIDVVPSLLLNDERIAETATSQDEDPGLRKAEEIAESWHQRFRAALAKHIVTEPNNLDRWRALGWQAKGAQRVLEALKEERGRLIKAAASLKSALTKKESSGKPGEEDGE